MLDTPFLRRVREKGRVEGQTEGLDKGRSEGLREAILDVLVTRLSISVPAYRRLERHLSTLTDFHRLRDLHQAALVTADLTEFEQALASSDLPSQNPA